MPDPIADNRNGRTSITIAQNALIIAILRKRLYPFYSPQRPQALVWLPLPPYILDQTTKTRNPRKE